jgi:sodium-dependent dicarboxylate transporter 2/3/5
MFTVALWVSESAPLPAGGLAGVALSVALGVQPLDDALRPFANPIIFLFLGSFLIAHAMTLHGLARRVGRLFTSGENGLARPWRTALLVTAAVAGLSSFLSNTATTAMFFPVALALLGGHARPEDPRGGYPAALLIGLSFASTIGGLMTPVGTPPNLIGMAMLKKFAKLEVSFLQWMAMGAVVSIALFALLQAIMRLTARGAPAGDAKNLLQGAPVPRPTGSISQGSDIQSAARARPRIPFTRSELAVAIVFALTVALWLTPSLAQLVLGADHPVAKSLAGALPEGLVGLGGGLLLFLIPVDLKERRFVLGWREAHHGVDWGVLLLFGAGLSLGQMFFSTGLAESVGRAAAEATGVRSAAALTLLMALLAAALSEATSNTATATLIVPVAIAVSGEIGVAPAAPALAAAMASSLGNMLPVSTAPNAIVYGGGWIRLRDMALAGALVDAAGAIVIWLVVLVMAPLVGLG